MTEPTHEERLQASAARQLDVAILQAKRYGVEPSWSNRAWLCGWGLGLLVGMVVGILVPPLLEGML
jgi:hypothetical protein